MEPTQIENTLNEIRAALETDQIQAAIAALVKLHPVDRAEAFADLDDRDQAALLPQLDIADTADLLEELDDEEAADVAQTLPAVFLANILDAMEPDEAADVLGDLAPEQAAQALAEMDDPTNVIPLLGYEDETAGGLMTTPAVTLKPDMTAAEAIDHLRQSIPGSDTPYYLYVTDHLRKLVGILGLRDLVVANPDRRIERIMDPRVLYATADLDQEEVARLMVRYDLTAIPVVDQDKVLWGVITYDDLMDVLEDEVTEDFQRLGGAEPLDQPYLKSAPTEVARKRIGWLMLLFLTESLTGTVLRHFEHELQAVVALAFFVPLLIGTGGNAGSQTTSTLIRALAIRDVEIGDALRIWWHELRVGLLIGVGMGVLAYIRAVLWGSDAALSWTVAVSITVIVIWANIFGSLLPVLATRFRIDPTVVSGPVMSTLVDATGLFIYFTVAKAVLGI